MGTADDEGRRSEADVEAGKQYGMSEDDVGYIW